MPPEGNIVSNNYIIVPCRNEAGNIPQLVQDFFANSGVNDELWFVEGGSHDNTAEVCMKYSNENDSINFVSQKNQGKFNAVRTVIEVLLDTEKEGIIAIWDADHSIKYLDVKKALDLGKHGDSLIVTERIGAKIEEGAMPKINYLGNRMFAMLTSVIFSVKVDDALSGTKVFPIRIFQKNVDTVTRFLERDSYGDLSYFLLGRIHQLRTKKIKVDYFARVYGASGLNRFRNGLELLRSLFVAKFIVWSRLS